ncbi:axoneme-associated protein mst101(1)-like [Clinocottus analis]|uniref:axoneme-associated protein mst101(1)-like n=1 Tax=Clinocottus analis TaxID=304258 RepID=UPI0035C0B4B6
MSQLCVHIFVLTSLCSHLCVHIFVLTSLFKEPKEKSKPVAVVKKEPVVKEKNKPAAVVKKEPAVKAKPAAAAKKEPAAAQRRRKRSPEATEASAVRSKAKASAAKRDPDLHLQPVRPRTRLETVRRTNVTTQLKDKPARAPEPAKTRTKLLADLKSGAEKKSVKEAGDEDKQPQAKETQTDDLTTDKKKPSQRYFQCIYVPGKNAQYPLRPLTPAVSPAMMSPAIRSMLEQQQRAARAAGQ